jgi:hypothetical protein
VPKWQRSPVWRFRRELVESGAERLSWYSASIDSNYLTGKRVFVFGDATHAIAAARIASEELGFKVCGLAPIPANLPAMCARPPRNTASSR